MLGMGKALNIINHHRYPSTPTHHQTQTQTQTNKHTHTHRDWLTDKAGIQDTITHAIVQFSISLVVCDQVKMSVKETTALYKWHRCQ